MKHPIMEFDHSKLRKRIVEVCGTQQACAQQMGKSRVTIVQKMHGRINFSQGEILQAARILSIPDDEILSYFFTEKVKKNEPENQEVTP